MPRYELSRLALADLKSIARYTLQNWGPEQAERYIDELRKILSTLAENPGLGRACDNVRAGYRRMEHGSHVVFYRAQAGGEIIEVIRILHKRMLPHKHLDRA